MKVKVYSTQMGEKEVTIQGENWGSLQDELRKQGISYSGMKAVIGETKHTLEVDSAKIPQTDFTLFLMPVKTKSGSMMSYKELRGSIKTIIDSEGEEARQFFNQGKNYTTKSAADLQSLYDSWMRGASVADIINEAISSDSSSSFYTNMSYKQLRGTIKDILDAGPDSAKDYFNSGGRNYTTKGTEALRELLINWTGAIPAPVSAIEIAAQEREEMEEQYQLVANSKDREDEEIPDVKLAAKEKKVIKGKQSKQSLEDLYRELENEFPNVKRTSSYY